MARESTRPSDDAVQDMIGDVEAYGIDNGGSKFPGMSYEDGVTAALRWAVGESDDHPYED